VDDAGAGCKSGLRVGDRITRVGAFDLAEVTHDEAVAIIKEELGMLVRASPQPRTRTMRLCRGQFQVCGLVGSGLGERADREKAPMAKHEGDYQTNCLLVPNDRQ